MSSYNSPFLTLDEMRRQRAEQLSGTMQGAAASVPQAFLSLDDMRREDQDRQRKQGEHAEDRATAAADRTRAMTVEDHLQQLRDAAEGRAVAGEKREAVRAQQERVGPLVDVAAGGPGDIESHLADLRKSALGVAPDLGGDEVDAMARKRFMTLEDLRREAALRTQRDSEERARKATAAELTGKKTQAEIDALNRKGKGGGGDGAGAPSKADEKAKAAARQAAEREFTINMRKAEQLRAEALRTGTQADTQRAMGRQDKGAEARAAQLDARATDLEKKADEAEDSANKQREMRRRTIEGDDAVPTVDATDLDGQEEQPQLSGAAALSKPRAQERSPPAPPSEEPGLLERLAGLFSKDTPAAPSQEAASQAGPAPDVVAAAKAKAKAMKGTDPAAFAALQEKLQGKPPDEQARILVQEMAAN